MSNANRYVVVLEKGRKWADVYDGQTLNGKGKPKLVGRMEPSAAAAAVAALNAA